MTDNCSPLHIRSFRAIALAVGLIVLATSTANATDIRELIIGVGESGRVGNWIPVKVAADGLPASTRMQLLVTASDAKGDDCVNVVASGTTDEAGALQLEGVFPPGRLDGTVLLQLTDPENQILWGHIVGLTTDQPAGSQLAAAQASEYTTATATGNTGSLAGGAKLQNSLRLVRHNPLTVLTVGHMPGLAELIPLFDSRDATRGTVVNFVEPSFVTLPTTRRGFDAVDVLVLNSSYGLNADQAMAVQNWVMTGGHLIVSGGDSLPALLSSPIGQWLGPMFGIQPELIRSQDLSALQNFVIGANQLQTNRKDVAIVRVESKQSFALVDSINGPLVSRATAGGGLVTFVSVDLNQEPLSSWLSLPQLYEMLMLGRLATQAEEQLTQRQMISSTGVSDLATQLAAVSDAVPAADRWTSWHVMLFMVILLALIGPLDYLLVVKLLGRPKLTWLTFPVMIGSACFFAWYMSFSERPREVVRAVHLLDVGQSENRQVVRARSWSSLSTRDSRFARVSASPVPFQPDLNFTKAETNLSWHGRAEDIFGGLYRPGGAGLGKASSRRAEGSVGAFESLPLLADGSQAFIVEHFGDVSDQKVFVSDLRIGAGGLLEGSFEHHMKGPIRNWIIAFGSRIYMPSRKVDESADQLLPGQKWNRESGKVKISEIRDFLKGVRAIENSTTKKGDVVPASTTQVQTPYDSSGTDPQDILTMISLFEIAGGENFVTLSNDALRRDELSKSIGLNCAVLIGVLDSPLSELVIDDQEVVAEKSETIVRLMLPVNRLNE